MKIGNVLKNLPKVIIFLLFFGLSAYFLFYSSPAKIVDFIGVNNAYILIFFLALFGGFTMFSGIPYHVILITLAMGSTNPIILGLSAAVGVMIGDSTSYYIGYQGATILPRIIKKILQPIRGFAFNHPKILPWIFFSYGALIPFSNDFIVISMGLSKYPFKKVMIPLGLGNIVFNVSLAFFAKYLYTLLQGFLF